MYRATLLAAALLGPAAAAHAATPSFSDSFDHFVHSPDGSQGWMTRFPYGPPATRTLPSNHEAECYVDSSVGGDPFKDSNGILTIRATKATGHNWCGLPYDSGLITTFHRFAQRYGVFTVRAKLPAGTGLWPAWWFLPANNIYTAELDAFEVIGQDPKTLYFTTHGNDSAGHWTVKSQALHVPDLSADFHIYQLTWGPKQIFLALDGHEIGSAPTPASMNAPMYMLLNLAVGGAGSWPGQPNGATHFPAGMQIDWVRAWRLP